jgi:hypothetical protein
MFAAWVSAYGEPSVRPFHQPGVTTRRAFSGYSPEQEAKWQILSDIAYAAGYGYSQTRLPTPGAALSSEAVAQRVHQVEEGWTYESKRDKGSTGLSPDSELPTSAQYYLTERLLPFPQTDRPWQPRYVVRQED